MHVCKICQSTTRTIQYLKKELYYHRCYECGFVSLDDKFMVDETCEKKQYEYHNNSFESLGYVEMFEKFIVKAVEPYISEIKTALDFGCGPGPVLAELLRRKGVEVDEYDYYFSPQKVYEGKKYDLITSTEVFEHLKEPIKTLELLVQSLHKNAYIVLMTQFPPSDDKLFLAWWYRRDVTHISFFTPRSFEIMAEKVALNVVKVIDKNIVIFQILN